MRRAVRKTFLKAGHGDVECSRTRWAEVEYVVSSQKRGTRGKGRGVPRATFSSVEKVNVSKYQSKSIKDGRNGRGKADEFLVP
jgi:hypothetical protein